MGSFIGSILDNLVTLFGLIFSIVVLIQKRKGAGKYSNYSIPQWLLFLLIIVFTINLISDLPNVARCYYNLPISRKRLAKKFMRDGKTVYKDKVIESIRGYKVMIPAGFTYMEVNDTMPFYIMNKKTGALIVCEVLPEKEHLSAIFLTLRENLPKYTFDDSYIADSELPPRVGFTVLKREGLRKGEIFVVDYNNTKALIGVSSLNSEWEKYKDTFYKIVKAFQVN